MGSDGPRLRRSQTRAPDKSKLMDVELLADSGSWYLVLVPEIVGELGLKPIGRRKLTLADGREIDAEVVPVSVELLGREGLFMAAVVDAPAPLLGTEVMEALGFALDPTTGELKAVRPALLLV